MRNKRKNIMPFDIGNHRESCLKLPCEYRQRRSRMLGPAVLALCCLTGMRVSAQTAVFPTQGIYEICPAAGVDPEKKFVVDEKHCTELDLADGTVQLYRALGCKQQEFFLEMVSPHSCRIISLETGRYLTQAKAKEGSILTFEEKQEERPPGEADGQLWNLVSREDGSFLLRSADELYLTLEDGYVCNGAALSLEAFDGGAGQRWLLQETPVYPGGAEDTDVVNPYEEDGPLYDLRVTVRIHDKKETLTAQTLKGWMVSADGQEHELELDEEKLQDFVANIAQKYNTVGKARNFRTSYGNVITLVKGNFGWKLDEKDTLKRLQEAVRKRGSRTILPCWSQRGGDYYGTNTDIGDSYVEVDLNAQKVWLYQNGKKLLETDCVSGTKGTDRETPGGVYYIFYKQAPATLNGQGYSSYVHYWMAFNGGIGLHDAPWRSKFGGEIYKTDGSHGCINLPYEPAETIYETVTIGYPVVCYH